MIKLLESVTMGGIRCIKGSILDLDTTLEDELIRDARATRSLSLDSMNALPERIVQWNTPVTRTAKNSIVDPDDDTDFATLATVIVPGRTMGRNSRLLIGAHWDLASATGTKTLAMDWGGSNFSGPTFTSNAAGWIVVELFNAGSLTAQKALNAGIFGSNTAAVHSSLAKDTTANVAIDFKGKWSGATPNTETMTLLAYYVWHFPGDD